MFPTYTGSVKQEVSRLLSRLTLQCIDVQSELESCGGCIDGHMLYNGTIVHAYDGVKYVCMAYVWHRPSGGYSLRRIITELTDQLRW